MTIVFLGTSLFQEAMHEEAHGTCLLATSAHALFRSFFLFEPTGLRPNIVAYSLSRVRLSYFRVRIRFLIGAVHVKKTKTDENWLPFGCVTEVISFLEERNLLHKFICLQRKRVDQLAGCSPPVGWWGCRQRCWRSSSMAG